MERSTNPTPINPNAKYLPDSLSNVLNTIQKFDQCLLAWPKCPRKGRSWTKKLSRVPLAGSASSLISNCLSSESKHCERVDKKNTFYQILQASQDQPSFEKSARRRKITGESQSLPNSYDKYNSIYDVKRTYLQLKEDPQPKGNQDQSADSLKVAPRVKEIYRVPPRVSEKTAQPKYFNGGYFKEAVSKEGYSKEEYTKGGYSKGERFKSKSPEAKIPLVESFIPRKKHNEPSPNYVIDFHKSIYKSKPQKSGANIRREHPIKETDKAHKILQEKSKDGAKAHHHFRRARSPRRKPNKSQKRTADPRLEKGDAKESVKLRRKSPRNGLRLKKVNKSVQEEIPDNSKKGSRIQHESARVQHQQDRSSGSVKLQNKSHSIKNDSKGVSKIEHESTKVESRQDSPRESVKLQDDPRAINDLLKDISKFAPKAKPYHVNFNEITKSRRISSVNPSPARRFSKPRRTIYNKLPRINMPKHIENISNNVKDKKLYEIRRKRRHSRDKNIKKKVAIDSREIIGNRFDKGFLNEIFKTGANTTQRSKIQGRPKNKKGSEIHKSKTKGKKRGKEDSLGSSFYNIFGSFHANLVEDPKSTTEGRPNITEESKVQESNTEGQKSSIKGRPNNTVEIRTQESNTKYEISIVEGRPKKTKETKIQESNTEGQNSFMEGRLNNTEEIKIQEINTEVQQSITEGKPHNQRESTNQESNTEGQKNIIEERPNKKRESKIQESNTENRKSIKEERPDNKRESNIGESNTENRKSITEERPQINRESRILESNKEGRPDNKRESKERNTEGQKGITKGKPYDKRENKIEESNTERQKSITEERPQVKSKIQESNTENRKSSIEGQLYDKRESKIQESNTEGQKSITEGNPHIKRESTNQESNTEGQQNIIEGRPNKKRESKIRENNTENRTSIKEERPDNKRETKIRESNTEGQKDIIEGKPYDKRESKIRESNTEGQKSITEGKLYDKRESKIQEINTENRISVTGGKSYDKRESKIQESNTENQKSVTGGRPNNTVESKIQENNTENRKSSTEERLQMNRESKIQESNTENRKSIKEGRPQIKWKSKIQENILKNRKSTREVKHNNKRKPKNPKSNTDDQKIIIEGSNTEGQNRIIEGKPYTIKVSEIQESNTENRKIIIEERPDSERERIQSIYIYDIAGQKSIIEAKAYNKGESEMQENNTENQNSIIEGRSDNKSESKIQLSDTEAQSNVIEGGLNYKKESNSQESSQKGKKKGILKREGKAKPVSIRNIQRKRILFAGPSKRHSIVSRRVQLMLPGSHSGATLSSAYEPPIISSDISSVTQVPLMSSRVNLLRRRSMDIARMSRKLSVIQPLSYQETLWKLKDYLNNHDMDDEMADAFSLDFDDIQERDLLFYPYDDLYKKAAELEDKNGVKERNRTKPKPRSVGKELKPTEMEMELEKYCKKPLKKKSACCMCKSMRCPEEEAPFLEEMRKEQKRQELMAYRTHMAMCNKPSQASSRARQLSIRNVDKKLYSLEDKKIIFTRPKRSNSSIFHRSSKSKTFLKRSHSFTSHKESSRIICS